MRTHYVDRSARTERDLFLAGLELGFAQANALLAPVVVGIALAMQSWLVAGLFILCAIGGWGLWWRNFRFALCVRVRPEPPKPYVRLVLDTSEFEAKIRRIMGDDGSDGAA